MKRRIAAFTLLCAMAFLLVSPAFATDDRKYYRDDQILPDGFLNYDSFEINKRSNTVVDSVVYKNGKSLHIHLELVREGYFDSVGYEPYTGNGRENDYRLYEPDFVVVNEKVVFLTDDELQEEIDWLDVFIEDNNRGGFTSWRNDHEVEGCAGYFADFDNKDYPAKGSWFVIVLDDDIVPGINLVWIGDLSYGLKDSHEFTNEPGFLEFEATWSPYLYNEVVPAVIHHPFYYIGTDTGVEATGEEPPIEPEEGPPVEPEEEPPVEPGGEEETIVAPTNPGETKPEKSIPAGAIAVVIAGGAAAAAAAKKKKKKPGKKKPEKEEPPEEKARYTYELRVTKEFGDTLITNEEYPVYARIVKICQTGSKAGEVTSCPDLTRLITISTPMPDDVSVAHQQMTGDYMAALVLVYPKDGKGKVPDEITVSFCFASSGGSYTQNMVFNVLHPHIEFLQPNATLPACTDEVFPLPFLVTCHDPHHEVEARVDGKGYKVELRLGESEPSEQIYGYIADLTEIRKKELPVGETEPFWLVVSVTYRSPDGSTSKTENSIMIYRMGMGAALTVDYIGAYVDDSGMPEPTRCHLMALTWDRETHEVTPIMVDADSFEVRLRGLFDREPADRWEEYDAGLVDRLSMVLLPAPQEEPVDPNLGAPCDIYCCGGALMSPQRLYVDIRGEVKVGEETFKFKNNLVPVYSQRVRQFASKEAEQAALKRDTEEVGAFLMAAKNRVLALNLDAVYPTLGILVDMMTEMYDVKFGYDEALVNKIRRLNMTVLEHAQAEAFDGIEAVEEKGKSWVGMVTLLADQAGEVDKMCSNWTGFAMRLGLGVFTGGASELPFMAARAWKGVRHGLVYGKRDGGYGMWLDGFYGGVDAVKWDIIFAAAGEAGGRLWAKYKGKPPNVNGANAASKKLGAKPAGRQPKAGTSGKTAENVKTAAKKVEDAETMAWRSADTAVDMERRMTGEAIDKAFEQGQKEALEKLKAMRKMSGAEFEEAVLAIQMDKAAMYQLKWQDKGWNSFRARFNQVVRMRNEETIRLTREALAKELDVPVSQIRVTKVSSAGSYELEEGLRTTMDLDATFEIVKDGKVCNIPQSRTQPLFEQSVYRSWNRQAAPSQDIASKFAKAVDNTNVQAGHAENYFNAKTAQQVIDPKLHGQRISYDAIDKTANAMAYKGGERLARARELIATAEGAAGVSKDAVLKQAAYEMTEGMRQIVKQSKYVIGRNAQAMAKCGENAISSKLNMAWKIMEKSVNGQVPPGETAKIIKKLTGMSLEEVCDATGNALRQANANLDISVISNVGENVGHMGGLAGSAMTGEENGT